jgi:UDP-GlcNAc:undecaprenyl-phosphate GlcNAc-1-phosphate transferase
MSGAVVAGTFAAALALGVAVPWALIRMLVPALRQSPRAVTKNFRGKDVFHGLGIVWLIWAGCAIVGGVASSSIESESSLAVLTLAGPFALVAFALGAVDDAYGSSDARGFRGHLRELMGGRLTTGGLKLLGIGTASLVVALVVAPIASWGGETVGAQLLGKAVLAGAAIALTSNFVNLTDLRPGRALKVYGFLAILGVASTLVALAAAIPPIRPESVAVDSVALTLFVLGPVVAVWRYDLGEEGMLGDAGANPMGAVAGMLIVLGLPLWGLIAYLALMLGLNLTSERFSFSRVIESNRVLNWIDVLGRLPAEKAAQSGEQPDPRSDRHPG